MEQNGNHLVQDYRIDLSEYIEAAKKQLEKYEGSEIYEKLCLKEDVYGLSPRGYSLLTVDNEIEAVKIQLNTVKIEMNTAIMQGKSTDKKIEKQNRLLKKLEKLTDKRNKLIEYISSNSFMDSHD